MLKLKFLKVQKNLFFFKLSKKCVANYDPTKDYYKVLEISQSASEKEIKVAYYKLAKKYHPDLTNGQTTEKFKEINQAYEILSDKDKKLQYDASRKFNSFWGGKTYSQQQQQSRQQQSSYTGNTYSNYNYNYNNFRGGFRQNYQEDPFSKNFNDWFKGFREKYSAQEDYKSNFSSGKKYDFSSKYYEKNKNYFKSFERGGNEEKYQRPREKKEATFGKKYYEKNKKYYESFKKDSSSSEGYQQNYDRSGNYYNYNQSGTGSSFVLFLFSIVGVVLGSIIINALFRGNSNKPAPYQREHHRSLPRRPIEPAQDYSSNREATLNGDYSQSIKEPNKNIHQQTTRTSSPYSSNYGFERIDKNKSTEVEHGMKDDPFYKK